MPTTDDVFGKDCSLETAKRIDALCNSFERAWQEGGQPEIEPLVAQISEIHRWLLLRQLLMLDIQYRQRDGKYDESTRLGYAQRFPEYAGEIARLLQTLHGADAHVQVAPESPVKGFRIRDRDVTHLREYELIQEIGQGGMGRVFLARHVLLNRLAAVKVPLEAEMVARFRREIESIGKLDHKNITRPFEANLDDIPFLVMEYVDGLDLRRITKAMGPLPIADACEIIRQACVGLQHAHENRLVHRDLKPTNLLVSVQGVVKILDLGLARIDDPKRTDEELTSSRFVGTFHYAAPEQARDPHTVDIRGDIYSLGCTLFALLTGGPPYPGRGTAVLLAHQHSPIPSIERLRPDVPKGLAFLIEKLLGKSRDDRPAIPREVAQMLAPFTAGAGLTSLVECARSRLENSPGLGPDPVEPPTHDEVAAASPEIDLQSDERVLDLAKPLPSPARERMQRRPLSRRGVLWAAGGAALLGSAGGLPWVFRRRGVVQFDPALVECSPGWQFDRSAALSPKSREAWLRLSGVLQPALSIELTAERWEGHRFSIIVADDRFPLTIAFDAGVVRTEITSADRSRSEPAPGILHADWGEWKDPEPRRLALALGPHHVRLERAGAAAPLLDWQGDLAQFSARAPAALPDEPGIYLYTSNSVFRFSDAAVVRM